ncbi:DUF4258 domain-containing protein [Microbacterium sp. NPDC089696]|uniref:DUF4258 domain-containing protein n=1 Tax=Microbacterium sp. NPDC089696 TaxID=3364199 RepID=UPI0037FFA706
MQRRNVLITKMGAALLAISLAVFPISAAQGDDESGHEHPVADIESIAPDVVDAAILSRTQVAAVQIPLNPAEGIDLHTSEGPLTVDLPSVDGEQQVVVREDGVVGYVNGDGSSTVPLRRDGGALQLLTVIDSPDAPVEYEYELTLPKDATPILNHDGSVSVESHDGAVLAYVPAPWAKDAVGAAVPTHYEVRGASLVQVVHHVGATYPVVADPFWIPLLRLVAQWSKHALKQIAERNITENLVKIALQEGRRTKGNEKGTSVFEANGIRVVVNDKTGTIITVTRSGGGGSSGGR